MAFFVPLNWRQLDATYLGWGRVGATYANPPATPPPELINAAQPCQPAEDPAPHAHRLSPTAMAPSSTLPSGFEPSSFGSVDWLSRSSHVGPAHTSRPAEVSRGSLSAPAKVSGSGELPLGTEEAKPLEVSAPGTPSAGRCGDGWGGGSLHSQTGTGARRVLEEGGPHILCTVAGGGGWGLRFHLTPLSSKHFLSEGKAPVGVFLQPRGAPLPHPLLERLPPSCPES